jgi:hypothetical protein
MTALPALAEFAKTLLEDSVMKGNSAILFNSLTEEFKTTLTISELSRRLAQMEHDHGMFTRVDLPPPPIPDPAKRGLLLSRGRVDLVAASTRERKMPITPIVETPEIKQPVPIPDPPFWL